MIDRPTESLAARATDILGWRPQSWARVVGGYTPTARWLVRSGQGSAFVKAAVDPLTSRLLRREFVAYRTIHGAFMPTLIGCDDDELEPVLVLEDLSGAYWPPPWRAGQIGLTLERIGLMHSAGGELPPYETVHGDKSPGWAAVAADSTGFLGLGLVTADWLGRALPALVKAEAACDPRGEAVTHWDIRSDNVCLARDEVKFIDWAEACLSNPKLDIGFWLPSLAFEGGPQPEEILPGEPDIAAWVSGYFAARAGLPAVPGAPGVRRVQMEQLSTALPWAIRALGLEAP